MWTHARAIARVSGHGMLNLAKINCFLCQFFDVMLFNSHTGIIHRLTAVAIISLPKVLDII